MAGWIDRDQLISRCQEFILPSKTFGKKNTAEFEKRSFFQDQGKYPNK